MTDAKRDNNQVPVMLGVLDSDGETPTMVKVVAATHVVCIDDNTTGSDNSRDDAYRDNNQVTTLLGVSEADGVTPVPIYVNSSNELLVDSN